MAENDTELSEEELLALSESSKEEFEKPINASGNSPVLSHDLASEDSSLGFNQAAVDLVNERFARQIRIGLIEVLRTTPKIAAEKIKIQTFRESMEDMAAPLAISTVKMDPLRGMSLVIIEPKIIFSALDSFFGGFGKQVGPLTATRIFTPTEDTIIGLLMNIIFASLKEAWAPVMPVSFERVAQEVNPAFAQIADDDDLMLVSRFNFSLGDDVEGHLTIIQPFSLLKPVRDLLRSRIQTNDEEDEQTVLWERDLTDATYDVPVTMSVKVSELEVTYGQLESLKVGQVLPLDLFEQAEVNVAGATAFHGTVGEFDGQMSVKLKEYKKKENQ